MNEYIDTLESAVSRKKGKPYMANPLSFNLMLAWQKQEVPLHLILDEIDKADGINSVAYVKDRVEKRFDEWQKRIVKADVEPTVQCEKCFDSGTVMQKVGDNDWNFEEVDCGACI